MWRLSRRKYNGVAAGVGGRRLEEGGGRVNTEWECWAESIGNINIVFFYYYYNFGHDCSGTMSRRWRLPSLNRCYIILYSRQMEMDGKKRVFNNIICVQCHHRGRHSRLVLFMLLSSVRIAASVVNTRIILVFSRWTSYVMHTKTFRYRHRSGLPEHHRSIIITRYHNIK